MAKPGQHPPMSEQLVAWAGLIEDTASLVSALACSA
jgi:hypothetical protein